MLNQDVIKSPALDDRLLSMDVFEDASRALREDGSYPALFFNSPAIFELEKSRIFAKAWIYLGHVSEIPDKGDYVRRYIVDDQFIVLRDRNNDVRALHNSCRHRGMQICRSDQGNAGRFVCPYHGWTFSNTGELSGVPLQSELYGPQFEKKNLGLRNIPRLEICYGMIFGCLDPEAPTLDAYLGDMKWYLELLAARTPAGLEVIGPPTRWVVDTDWKFGADNFAGDAYHTFSTHMSMIGTGLDDTRNAAFAVHGHHIHAGDGHCAGLGGAPPGAGLPPYFGLPESMRPAIEATLSADQRSVLQDRLFMHATVFPNFSMLTANEPKDERSTLAPFLTFRVWQPIAPGKMEIWSWFMIDADAPPEFKKESYHIYVKTFGSAGGFEQDDAENWRSITKATKGHFASTGTFNFQMSVGKVEKMTDWPGPGDAYPTAFADMNQIAFHERWLAYMMNRA